MRTKKRILEPAVVQDQDSVEQVHNERLAFNKPRLLRTLLAIWRADAKVSRAAVEQYANELEKQGRLDD